MEDAVQENPAGNMKMPDQWNELTQLQKDIYKYLWNKREKALHIAKGINKHCGKDVNPHLYNMKAMNLVDKDDSMLWFIKSHCNTDEQSRTETKNLSKLTEQQEKICHFLKNAKPQRASSISKGVGRTTAKDVNPDLYKLKDMDLLSYNKEEQLWSLKHAVVPDGPNSMAQTTEAASLDREAAPPEEEYKAVDSLCISGEHTNQTIVNKYYYMYNCQNFGVGDKMTQIISIKENVDPRVAREWEQYGAYAYEPYDPTTTSNPTQNEDSNNYDSGIGSNMKWNEWPDPQVTAHEMGKEYLVNGNHSEDASDSSLLNKENDLMRQNLPAITSSLITLNHSIQTIDISDICQELENVTLEKQEEKS